MSWRQAFSLDGAGLVGRPSWHLVALCRGTDPAVWFPVRGTSLAPLRALCRACPARSACLAHAVNEPELLGVWAGASMRERSRLRASGEVTTTDGDVIACIRPDG